MEADDPYCYPGTDVLKNLAGFTDRPSLETFEAADLTSSCFSGVRFSTHRQKPQESIGPLAPHGTIPTR